jgi:amino acid adenylation domain-containing protein/thioester reductase-like protein
MQNPESNLYNLSYLLKISKKIDLERLREAILKTLDAHPYSYCRVKVNEEGNGVQYIDDAEGFQIDIEEVADIETVKPHLLQTMRLDGGKLFYFKLLSAPEANYIYFQFHHIVFDGASLRILVRDIDNAYQGKTIENEPISSIDFALNEFEQRQGELWKNDQQWYREHFVCDDVDTVLQPDLEEETFRSRTVQRNLEVDAEAINRFCKQNKVSLDNYFTSAYALLMSRYTGDDQVLFSTIWHGRGDFHLARTFGMFVRTVPAFFSVNGDMTVDELFKQGPLTTEETRKHSLYSYADFCGEQGVETHQMFVYQGKLFRDMTLGSEPMTIEQLVNNMTNEPLEIQVFQTNDAFVISISSHAHRYSEVFVEQLIQSYETVLGQMMDLKKPLKEIQVVSDAQLKLLDKFNETDSDYDNSQTIVSLFQKQAQLHADKVAVVFKDKRFTYKELDEVSDHVAQLVASKGLGAEDVVSILIPRSEWMAIASLGVLKAGCAYQPLDPSYPKERLEFMMTDSATKLLIADEELLPLADTYQGEVVLTKDLDQSIDTQVNITPPTPHSLMTMIYTSGTTGVPKGCQIEHRNVVAFCHMHDGCHHITEDCKIAAYASFGFDASIQELFVPLTIGAELYIIPEEIRLDLMALNDYFEQNGITHSFMTTQVAYQFATNFECKSLQRLLTGGEKLPSMTPPKNYVVANGYGPSEAICYVTNFDVTEERKNIPIGKAQRNVKCYIVDKYGHRLPVGAAGELWVATPQVTRGYLNRPEKTAEVYIDNPFDKGEKYNRVYRSGDIVRYLPSGDIEFVGRKDGQVKIRGFRVELKEVESVIRQFEGIKDVTVQAFDEEGGGKFIAAYIVSDQQIDIQALNNFIMDEKPPYMVPAVTMQIERIPLNQNQKVDKKALPKPEKTSASFSSMAENVPMNVLEQEIHDIIKQIINNEDFGLTTPLGYAGLTSIMAIKLAIQINKRFGVTLDSKTLAKTGTVQSIENEILNKILHEGTDSQVADNVSHADMSRIPLSYAQMGVYVECMKQPESTLYNIPSMVRFPKDTDTTLLAQAVETVIKAHPQMRAHFGSEGSEIIQTVDFEQPVEIVQSQRSEAELEQYKREFVKPFNLRQGPLYHMEIVTTEQGVYLLHDVHHLVFDGGSLDLFLNQLCDLMNGKEIETEAYSYADFVAAEKAAENSPEHTAAEDFFQERLGKVEGVTEVPSDLTNPKEQGITETVTSKLDFDAVERFCRQHNLTPAHLTLAATFYALSRFTNNEQLCITTISNGRSDLRISNTVGMFINTLALSANIGEQTVLQFLDETSKNFDETLRHEYYPFAQIANDYDLSAEIMFAYQVGVVNEYVCKGQTLEVENLELDVPKFRIAFYIINDETGHPCVCVQYDNGRYSHELMQNLAQSICNAAKAFIRQPEMKLQQVSLLDAGQIAILDSFNQTDVPYDDTQTIVSLFRRQVQMTPDNMAVVYHENRYTYREVDAITERIAAYLVSKGLGREDVVSIIIPRCEWMPIAALGVLKAGCAYQPLDPSYPAERLNFMMKDANAKLLIADEGLRSIVDEYQGEVLLTKDIDMLPSAEPVKADITPSSLFILLYTSGSTGTPKGCQLEHRNLVAFCHYYQKYFGLTANDKVAAYASYGFDVHMMDLYTPLTSGACVHIIGDDIRLNLPELNDYFNQQGITHSFITTQVGYQFATNVENHSLRCFAVGGEKLSALNPPTNYNMYNVYGPTECTVFITNYWVKDYELDIPIGKPLDNLKLYIVDKQFNRLPVGAMGELWVAGPQVSRGYLNRPEKTAETYIRNPFSDDPKYSRVYRTGDIVRYLPDGNIQFIGRRDGQVKIRGFRIELKEVEAVIRQFPGIKDATVQAFEYENGGKYIAAYIVSDEKVDIKQLNDFIGQQKPPYMIPAATMQIESIPLNQNQKVNRKALPAPVIQAADHEYVEPANDTERLFCKIFSDILSMDKIGATDNFFELGGTSLMVTRVIIEADKAGHHIAYGDVFANPTPRQLSSFLTGGAVEEDEEARNYNYGPIEKVLQGNTLDAFRHGEKQPIGNALVTGATGFLGIHILKELIDREDVPVIWCMVRAENEEKAERRLKGMLYYYFSHNYNELFGSRLRVINGDVTQEIKVDGKVDTVFNCAAVVKHFSKGTEIEDVNVGGTAHCVQFCLLNHARLIHVSTYSTAGMSINGMPPENTVYTEQKLYFGQSLNNQYVHSKFLSERVVLDAVALHKLNAKVMRVGNLAPRSTDGEFQINFQTNSAMGRIRVYQMLGCYPYDLTDTPMEFSPIDEVAKAIVLLSQTPQSCCLFHPYNNHYVHFGDVLGELAEIGKATRQVENEVFIEALESAKQDPEKAKRLSSLIAYEDMAHGQKAVMIPADNQYTSQVLYRLGFRWSSTSWDYVDQMLAAIAGFGYFEL